MWTTKEMNNQSGKTVVVTGANTGIGFETAKALYHAGAKVILACRSREKAETAILNLQNDQSNGKLIALELDLSSLESVKEFAKRFLAEFQSLDLLINNAGVMQSPEAKTKEGFELQFGTNFIGHFALTGLLYPLLQQTKGSRIITVSSLAYLRGEIDFDNLRSEKSYDPVREYCQSKLADLLFGLALHRRILAKGDSVCSIVVQPGANNTELARYMTAEDYKNALARFGELMEPWQGALPTLFAATSDDAKAGKLYGPDQDGGVRGYPAEAEIIPIGLDEQLGDKLWHLAETATGLQFP